MARSAVSLLWICSVGLLFLLVSSKPVSQGVTNAERFKRGLPPARPKALFEATQVKPRGPSTSPIPAQCQTENAFVIRADDDAGNTVGYIAPSSGDDYQISLTPAKSQADCFATIDSSGTPGSLGISSTAHDTVGYLCLEGTAAPNSLYFESSFVNAYPTVECGVWNLNGDAFSAGWKIDENNANATPVTLYTFPGGGTSFVYATFATNGGFNRIHFFRET